MTDQSASLPFVRGDERGIEGNGGVESQEESTTSTSVIRMKFSGANQTPKVTGDDKLPGIVNYFIGNDPEKWRTKIPTYKKVQYDNLYEGIDLVYYGNQGQLEYDLVVAAGANPNQIQLAFEGTEHLSINETGDLVLEVNGGEVRLLQPHVYQIADGKKIQVAANYVLGNSSSTVLPFSYFRVIPARNHIRHSCGTWPESSWNPRKDRFRPPTSRNDGG